jgi:nucleoside 2-deoxyribosyltransferase
MTPRVYLAGPDVFLPDAEAWAAEKRALCAEHGLIGITPLDPHEDPPDWAGLPEWRRIGLRNEARIRTCHAVIADLTPFRGPSADPGTVYEVGFARALGLPIFGYSADPLPFLPRTLAFLGDAATRHGEDWRDASGLLVEAFGCLDNLMIETGILESGGTLIAERAPVSTLFRRCLTLAAGALGGGEGRK